MSTTSGDGLGSSTSNAEDFGSPLRSGDTTAELSPVADRATTPDVADYSGTAEDTRLPAGTAPEGIAHTRTAALWTGLVAGAVILVILLVFILQNLGSVAVNIFVWEFELPLGISMLLAAIAGALVMALVGGVRILQIRRAAKRK